MRKALLYFLLNISNRLRMAFGTSARNLERIQSTGVMPAGNEIDDAVVRAFSQGSEAAFKKIYDHYAPAIYRVVSRYFRSPVLAEDLLLELFSEFWLTRQSYSEAAQLRLSLFTMARSLAIKYIGKMTTEVLSGQRAQGEKQGDATLNISPVKEAVSQQNISCNIDLEVVATPCITVWHSHNVGPVP